MPILNRVTKAITRPLPKMVSPKTHAIVDYLIAGSFLAMGTVFWSRNKRAALSAFFCGGAELAVSLLTDYPGGVKKVISFPMHGDIDVGLAAIAATMPEFMAFEEESEKAFFQAQGVMITAVTSLTEFKPAGRRAARGSMRKAA
ncbi:MAG: hypothetical protein DMG71_12630 [Acidobacteria bacterium]|nr:MAG: hypothetical protein DMG71_12630 [Acidobacteriota bacterium]